MMLMLMITSDNDEEEEEKEDVGWGEAVLTAAPAGKMRDRNIWRIWGAQDRVKQHVERVV